MYLRRVYCFYAPSTRWGCFHSLCGSVVVHATQMVGFTSSADNNIPVMVDGYAFLCPNRRGRSIGEAREHKPPNIVQNPKFMRFNLMTKSFGVYTTFLYQRTHDGDQAFPTLLPPPPPKIQELPLLSSQDIDTGPLSRSNGTVCRICSY